MTIDLGTAIGTYKIKMSYLRPSHFGQFLDHGFNVGGYCAALRESRRTSTSGTLHLRHTHGRDGGTKEKEDHI